MYFDGQEPEEVLNLLNVFLREHAPLLTEEAAAGSASFGHVSKARPMPYWRAPVSLQATKLWWYHKNLLSRVGLCHAHMVEGVNLGSCPRRAGHHSRLGLHGLLFSEVSLSLFRGALTLPRLFRRDQTKTPNSNVHQVQNKRERRSSQAHRVHTAEAIS